LLGGRKDDPARSSHPATYIAWRHMCIEQLQAEKRHGDPPIRMTNVLVRVSGTALWARLSPTCLAPLPPPAPCSLPRALGLSWSRHVRAHKRESCMIVKCELVVRRTYIRWYFFIFYGEGLIFSCGPVVLIK